MNKKKTFLLALLFCLGNIVVAQTAAYISIDGNTVPINNLLMTDSVVGGRPLYTASFVMPVNIDPAILYIQNTLHKGANNVSIIYSRAIGATIERQYRAVTVLQMLVPKLDATSRNSVKMEVKIRSTQVGEAANEKFLYKNDFRSTAVLISNFSASIGNLPTNYIASINGLELKSNCLLTFEISVRDIEAWKQWFNSPGKKMNGSVVLLSPNMRHSLKQFSLTSVEPVSMTHNIVTNGNNLERFLVVLKVASISLNNPAQ